MGRPVDSSFHPGLKPALRLSEPAQATPPHPGMLWELALGLLPSNPTGADLGSHAGSASAVASPGPVVGDGVQRSHLSRDAWSSAALHVWVWVCAQMARVAVWGCLCGHAV